MKASLISLVVFIYGLGIARVHTATESQSSTTDAQPTAALSYAWSETSEFARVPKSFLNDITIPTIEITDFETYQFVLKKEFIESCRLTLRQVERINSGMADALHTYRQEVGRHLEPTDKAPDFGPNGRGGLPAAEERFHFRLFPFPQEAAEIRRKLEEVVRESVGTARANLFWQNAQPYIDSEMKSFENELTPPAGRTVSITFTFQTGGGNPGIGLYRTTETTSLGGKGHSVVGRPNSAAFDQYAPEKMKPILARWRKSLAERSGQTEAGTPRIPVTASEPPARPGATPGGKPDAPSKSVDQAPSVQENVPQWDEESLFVDLPKRLIRPLRVSGLAADGGISPEAVTLFSLTPAESKSIRALFDEMKVRADKLEREHFARTEPGKRSFVVRAFPEKSDALKEEWSARLKLLIGKERAAFLDDSIRAPATMMPRVQRGRLGVPDRPPGNIGGDSHWQNRGAAEIQLNISPGNIGRDGMPTLRIEYKHINGRGGSGTWNGPRNNIPERWRHLITPELLGEPLTL